MMTQKRLKVLVVEDDRMLCQVFELFITQAGHEYCGFAHDSETALKLCEEKKPDIVLLDIHIKGKLNGIETNRLIYEQFNLPAIFLSSDAEEQTILDASLPNTYGFLLKPADKNLLISTIELAYHKHNDMIQKGIV